MMRLSRFRAMFIGAALLAAICLGISLANGLAVEAATSYTCTGGSVPAGTYDSLTIAGPCTLDAGSVTVQHNAGVLSSGLLLAAFGGSDLTVNGNLLILPGGALALGCEPEAFICFNDPDQDVGTLETHDVIGRNLVAASALAVLVHNDTIQGNAIISGGGGGVNCDPVDELQGSPAYATMEDTTIGGNAIISNWQSCWLGLFRNHIADNLVFANNVTADPDGNEIADNTIGGWLICIANSPAPQFGDSEGGPNSAFGGVGQCRGALVGA